MQQLSLFEADIIKHVRLVAESPRNAFYDLWLEVHLGHYQVRKFSGCAGTILDRRNWPFDSFKEASNFFDRRIKTKTNPNRKSPRIYRRAD